MRREEGALFCVESCSFFFFLLPFCPGPGLSGACVWFSFPLLPQCCAIDGSFAPPPKASKSPRLRGCDPTRAQREGERERARVCSAICVQKPVCECSDFPGFLFLKTYTYAYFKSASQGKEKAKQTECLSRRRLCLCLSLSLYAVLREREDALRPRRAEWNGRAHDA